MSIRATSLIYSAHNMCHDIHRNWLIDRALETPGKRLLYLPCSEAKKANGNEYEGQEYGYGKFRWYLDRFRHQGLQHDAFYYSSQMSRADADVLLSMLNDWEVVIFGGGSSELGMRRYREIGARFYGDPNVIQNIIHDRQGRGMLTAGFSAGADQLAELMSESAWDGEQIKGMGLAAKIAVTLHHESGREETLRRGAVHHPWVLWFGLPNDSGIATQQGTLQSGAFWQVAEFILDSTWDNPQDYWHIKTRHGMKIEHVYADGRRWSFNNGDRLIRVFHPDGGVGAWLEVGGGIIDYYSQQPTHFGSIGDILGSH